MASCSICEDFGLVHPRRPDGKVDYSSLIYCRCRGDKAGQPASRPHPEEESGGYYIPATPDIIDFPVSRDFLRCYHRHWGWADPGPDVPGSTQPADLEDRVGNLEAISAEPGRIPRYFHDRIQQLEGRVMHGEAKWQEHLGKSRVIKVESGGLRGIDV